MSDQGTMKNDDIFSKVIRAGRRTYFFDVRSTKADDYYLTITESKKFTNDDGSFSTESTRSICTKKILRVSKKP